MDETLIIVLEEKLIELIKEYKQRALEVSIAQGHAYNVELKIRPLAKLMERESEGLFSEEKILKECGLKGRGDGRQNNNSALDG